MNDAWVEASILLFIAETFVELFGLFDGLLVINVNASLLISFFLRFLIKFVLASPVTDSECCKLLYNWEKCRVPVVIIINMFQFMA
jgi:hypothetical protein